MYRLYIYGCITRLFIVSLILRALLSYRLHIQACITCLSGRLVWAAITVYIQDFSDCWIVWRPQRFVVQGVITLASFSRRHYLSIASFSLSCYYSLYSGSLGSLKHLIRPQGFVMQGVIVSNNYLLLQSIAFCIPLAWFLLLW